MRSRASLDIALAALTALALAPSAAAARPDLDWLCRNGRGELPNGDSLLACHAITCPARVKEQKDPR